MVHNDVVPSVNQVECHPFHQQHDSQGFARSHDVQLEAWGPFAEGKHDIFHNEVLRAVADKHSKSVAQVILRWLTQRGIVAIPKSVRKERMVENFDVFGFEIDSADMERIATLDLAASSFFDHRDPAMVKSISERRLNI